MGDFCQVVALHRGFVQWVVARRLSGAGGAAPSTDCVVMAGLSGESWWRCPPLSLAGCCVVELVALPPLRGGWCVVGCPEVAAAW